MALGYPQTIAVQDPPETDGLGRETTPGATVYEGKADVQEGAVERVDRSGQTFRVGDAKVFLPQAEPGIEDGHAVTITWADGSTQAATVAETRRLDDSLVLTYD
jgi:hypothetical protein